MDKHFWIVLSNKHILNQISLNHTFSINTSVLLFALREMVAFQLLDWLIIWSINQMGCWRSINLLIDCWACTNTVMVIKWLLQLVEDDLEYGPLHALFQAQEDAWVEPSTFWNLTGSSFQLTWKNPGGIRIHTCEGQHWSHKS